MPHRRTRVRRERTGVWTLPGCRQETRHPLDRAQHARPTSAHTPFQWSLITARNIEGTELNRAGDARRLSNCQNGSRRRRNGVLVSGERRCRSLIGAGKSDARQAFACSTACAARTRGASGVDRRRSQARVHLCRACDPRRSTPLSAPALGRRASSLELDSLRASPARFGSVSPW